MIWILSFIGYKSSCILSENLISFQIKLYWRLIWYISQCKHLIYYQNTHFLNLLLPSQYNDCEVHWFLCLRNSDLYSYLTCHRSEKFPSDVDIFCFSCCHNEERIPCLGFLKYGRLCGLRFKHSHNDLIYCCFGSVQWLTTRRWCAFFVSRDY